MSQRAREKRESAGGQKGGGDCSVTAGLSTKHWHPSENPPRW